MKYLNATDVLRRLKRSDSASRRLFFGLFGIAIFLLYFGPSVLRWVFSTSSHINIHDPLLRCIDDRYVSFLLAAGKKMINFTIFL